MTYEAAMIVITRPEHFTAMERFRAAGFIMEEFRAPSHIHTNHARNRARAEAVRKAARDDIVDGRVS